MSKRKFTSALTIDEATKRFNESLKGIEESERLIVSVTRSDSNSYAIDFEPIDSMPDNAFDPLGNQQVPLELGESQNPAVADVDTAKEKLVSSSKGDGGSQNPKLQKKPTYFAGGITFQGRIITARFPSLVSEIKNVESSTITQYSGRCGPYEFTNFFHFALSTILQCLNAEIFITTETARGDKPVVSKIEHSPNLEFPDLSAKTLTDRFMQLLKNCNQ